MDDAVDDELIETNPFVGWCFSKKEAPKDRDAIDQEQAVILQNLTGQGRNLIQFASWTGMRTSELVALDWTDVDFVRGVVVVSRPMTQQSKEAEVTKTDAGNREVKLLAGALEALVAQKQFTWLSGTEIFQNPQTMRRWAGDQPIRKTLWTLALKKGGIRYRYPYRTRHTYASMMLSAGEHPMWVARQMRHADWTMIARVYCKWMPDADALAGTRAEEIFGGVRQTERTS